MAKRKKRLIIELTITGDIDAAYDAVDRLLDNGAVQDLVQEYFDDFEEEELSITSALVSIEG